MILISKTINSQEIIHKLRYRTNKISQINTIIKIKNIPRYIFFAHVGQKSVPSESQSQLRSYVLRRRMSLSSLTHNPFFIINAMYQLSCHLEHNSPWVATIRIKSSQFPIALFADHGCVCPDHVSAIINVKDGPYQTRNPI